RALVQGSSSPRFEVQEQHKEVVQWDRGTWMLSGRNLREGAERARVHHHRDPALSETREDRKLFKEVGARRRDTPFKINSVHVAVPPIVVEATHAIISVSTINFAIPYSASYSG